jgi:hypothetical protein
MKTFMKTLFISVILTLLVGCLNRGEHVPCTSRTNEGHSFTYWKTGGVDQYSRDYQYSHCEHCNFRIRSY